MLPYSASQILQAPAPARTPVQTRERSTDPQARPHLLLALRRLGSGHRLLGLSQRKLQVPLLRQQAPRILHQLVGSQQGLTVSSRLAAGARQLAAGWGCKPAQSSSARMRAA